MAELESVVLRLCLKVGTNFFPEACFLGNQYQNQKKSEADLFEVAEGIQSSPEYSLENTEIGYLSALNGLEVHQAC